MPVGSFCLITRVRAHGMRTYEPRQGRKAATVVCSTSAVVSLTLLLTCVSNTFFSELQPKHLKHFLVYLFWMLMPSGHNRDAYLLFP